MEKKHNISDLYQMQSLPMQEKIQMTKRRINEWVDEYGSDGVYVSFSGGKDSTVLVDIVRNICGYKDIPLVFVDVPTQYPELKQFAQTFDNLEILKPKISFAEVCKKYGFPLFSKEISDRQGELMSMATANYKKLYAIKEKNKERILKVCHDMKNQSGIYFYTRTDENGISYFYIGQSIDCLERNISHLTGYQHIDLSIKKRGFYSEENPYGWKLNFIHYPADKLDEMEQYWILEYAKKGYQCRYNKTSGGQGQGKEKINEFKPVKTYRQGLKQGYKNASKEISHLFDLHLDYKTKSDKPNKNQQKALEKFDKFLNYYKDGDTDG